jgi:acetyltransferase-like isoleucine patch superfamily enzyme
MSLWSILSDNQKTKIRRTLYIPYMVRDILFCWWKRVPWHSDWNFYGLPFIRIGGRGSSISIGKNFIACSDVRRNSLGVFQRVIIKTVGHGAKIVIGDDVGISGCTISAATSITIGNHVLLGSGCLVTDSDAHPIDPEERRQGGGGVSKPIVIEDDVFVGARAMILKGVTIGKGSVVGAGAVVAKSVPPYSIVVGNPAKIVGDSRRSERVLKFESAKA